MSLSEAKWSGESVLWEANPDYCREEITVLSGQNLGANAVVGKISVGGKYAVYNDDAGDGTEEAAGVLLAAVDASLADKKGVVILRGPAILKNAALDWGSSDDGEQTAAIADLLALGILVR